MTATPAAESPTAVNHSSKSKITSWSRHVWIALVVVAILQGGVAICHWSILPSTARPLRQALGQLPLALGRSTGKDVPVESNVLDAVGAEQQVDRLYTGMDGTTVSVHCASFRPTEEWTPHPPAVCYRTTGWSLLESSTRSLPDRPQARIGLMTCEQSGGRVTVAYWYQMGDRTYDDRSSARSVRRSQWGRKEWPPLIKTLLQTDDVGNDAETRLVELASQIYDFNCKL
jgi:hypothetical protein